MAPSAGVLLTTFALAAPPAVRLTWDAPPSCPAAAVVEGHIAHYLGRPPQPASQDGPEANVHVAIVGGRYQARMHTRSAGRTGVRTLEGETCDELASATALIVAMMVDPNAVRGASAEAPAPAHPPSQAITAVDAPSPSPSRIQPSLLIGVAATTGALPEPSLGAAALLSVRRHGWELGLSARLWTSRSTSLQVDPEAGGDFSRVAFGPRAFRRWGALAGSMPRWGVRAGMGLDVVRVGARGYGVSDSSSDAFWGTEPVASVGAAVRLTERWWAHGDVEVAAALQRPTFTLVDRGAVWRPPPASGWFALGLAFAL